MHSTRDYSSKLMVFIKNKSSLQKIHVMERSNCIKVPFFLLCFSLLSIQFSDAQDLIMLRQKSDALKVLVAEVKVDEIKYKLWSLNQTDPVIVTEKEKISKIIFESEKVLNFCMGDVDSPGNYAGQRKHLLKVDIFSPTLGVSSFAYEKSIRPGRSYEIGLGIVGLGVNPCLFCKTSFDPNLFGFFLRVGYKFIHYPLNFTKTSQLYTKGKLPHLLSGTYLRPEVVLANYRYNDIADRYSSATFRNTGVAIMLNMGTQFIIRNRFAIDFFGGLGVGRMSTTQISKNFYYRDYQYLITDFGFGRPDKSKIGISIQMGFKAGVLIGKTKL